MKNRCLLTFFLIVFNTLGVLGQKFRYTTYQGDELPFKKVNQTIQDSHQYLWLATDQGLYRFDGNRFQDYNTSLRSQYIKSIISWKKDTLLFSNDTGIFKLFYKENTPKITPHIIISEVKNGMSYPEQLFSDSKDRLWIGQLDGAVYRQDRIDIKKQQFSIAPNRRISDIFFSEDRFGTVWILIPKEGLFYFDESSSTFEQLDGFNDMSHFYIEGDQIMLVGDLRVLKLKVNEDHRIIAQKQIDNIGLDFYYVSKDLNGDYFLASEQGMYTLINNQTELVEVFGSNDPHRVEKLPYTSINHLYFSQDQIRSGGKIWISTSNGLGLLWSSYFQSVSGMSHDNVFSMSTGVDNEVLISLSTVNSVKSTESTKSFDQITGVSQVTGISSHSDNTWYGTAEGTIIHYKNGNLQTTYSLKNRGGGIFYMFADHQGDNWFCQAPREKPIVGVAKISADGRVTFYDEANGLNNRILVINEGGRSELYGAGIGTKTYLYKYNRDLDTFENRSIPFSFKVSSNFEVHDLAVDDKGIVWLGTTDGLLKYDTESIQRIDLGAYTGNEIRSVCVIPGGGLWLATDTNGLVHIDAKGSYVFFDEKSGTPSKVASYRSMIIDSNGQLWVGTAEGAVYSSRSNPTPLTTNPPILDEIYINDKVEKLEKRLLRYKETEKARLSFVSVTFPSDNIRYQYKVYKRGSNKDMISKTPWSLPLDTNEITLQKLKSGTYFLLVRAQKQGGYSWSVPLKINLKVQNKWYKTIWGIALLLVFGVSGSWYILRLWVFKKTKNLEVSLSDKQKELHKKETELILQTEELKSTVANIHLLHRLLKQIPKEPSWDQVFPVLIKLVELPTRVDAFEIAFKKGKEIGYKGASREKTSLIDRNEKFDKKENLAAYVLTENKPLMIDNFNEEIEQYINKRDDKGYLSLMLLPFEQKTGTKVVFCVYGKEENKFTQRDFTLLQILTAFLSVSVVDELK
ncbi:ligand-binding sensor domain-containing protein [Aquimarina sp. 2304DJ70-9]|uniref:ligand-binding sensor domain-containing protein n=1 Tax=Aquimarina penaris TaxID=3231044 RepID=UPI003461E8B5